MFKASGRLPHVFTSKEAAQYLRFSEATILRLAKQGIIPGAKVGRIWRFSRETILNLLKQPADLSRGKNREHSYTA